MKQFGELFQTSNWKTEKHVPVIDYAEIVKAGDQRQLMVKGCLYLVQQPCPPDELGRGRWDRQLGC